MKRSLLLTILSVMFISVASAQTTPLWQGKGRIAISSDGNEHDHDDWAATPLSLAMLASQGLQDKLVLYTYSDHIWGSNQTHPNSGGMSAYEHMKESALGGARMFGFDESRFVCAVDNAHVAYSRLCEQINLSSAGNPLFIVAAGPMQVVGEAINLSDVDKRKYVTVISHSAWNEQHAGHCHAKNKKKYGNKRWWDIHTGWCFDEMIEEFGSKEGGEVKFIEIVDQNRGKDFVGLLAPRKLFDWIKESPMRTHKAYKEGSWDWLYSRLMTCVKRNDCFDPSDAGMVIYLLTGEEKNSPDSARKLMENPVMR